MKVAGKYGNENSGFIYFMRGVSGLVEGTSDSEKGLCFLGLVIINISLSHVTGLFSLKFLLKPAEIPTARASSFRLHYFPYYVWCS